MRERPHVLSFIRGLIEEQALRLCPGRQSKDVETTAVINYDITGVSEIAKHLLQPVVHQRGAGEVAVEIAFHGVGSKCWSRPILPERARCALRKLRG